MALSALPVELIQEVVDNLLVLTPREEDVSSLSFTQGLHMAWPRNRLIQSCSYCHQERDLAALARSCHHLHVLANPVLYAVNARHHKSSAVFHAAAKGHTGPLELSHRAHAALPPLADPVTLLDRVDIRYLQDSPELARLRDATWQVRRERVLHVSGITNLLGTPWFHFFDTLGYATPLHYAARYGRTGAVAWLLDHGADVDGPARGFCLCEIRKRAAGGVVPEMGFQWTPLHTAMCSGHEPTARLLVERGASMVLCDHRDAFSPIDPPGEAEVFTALALAVEKGMASVVEAIPARWMVEHADAVWGEWFTRTNRRLYEAVVEEDPAVEAVAAAVSRSPQRRPPTAPSKWFDRRVDLYEAAA